MKKVWGIILGAAMAIAADPTVTLPPNMKAKPGRLLKIEATSTGKTIRWVNVSEDADLIVSESGKWAIFSATTPGQYKVFAWTALGDVPSEASICTITVEGTVPPPNPPNPGPGPSPPNPPPGPPSPPGPDPLRATFAGIYGADVDPKKGEQKAILVGLYRNFAQGAANGQHSTVGDFYSWCRNAMKSGLSENALRPIREKVAEDLDKNLPLEAASAFTGEVRTKASYLFVRYANLLAEIP